MKTFLFCTIFSYFILFPLSMVASTHEAHKESDQPQIIKIGYLPNYAILNSPAIQGAKGYGYEYLSEIENYTNYKFQYMPVMWNEGLEKLKDGEIDLFGPVSITDERKEIYNYVHSPFIYERPALYAPTNTNYYYNNPLQLDGLRVGLLKGALYEKYLDQLIRNNNINIKKKYTESTDFNSLIKNGEIDIFLSGSLLKIPDTKIIHTFSKERIYLITNKEDKQLSETINWAMQKIDTDRPYFTEHLWNKYYNNTPKAPKSITAEEKSILSQKKVYSVGYHTEWKPLSYNENGEPRGFAIDIMNLLAKELAINLQYIPLQNGSKDNLMDLDFNLSPSDDDSSHGKFSEPYTFQNLIFLSKKGLSKNDIQTVIMPNYATISPKELLAHYPNAKVDIINSNKNFTKLYEKKDIDSFLELEPMVQQEHNTDITQYYNVHFLEVKVPLGITISNQLPNSVHYTFNNAILSLNKRIVDKIIIDNITTLRHKTSIIELLKKNIYTIILIVLGILFFIAFFYIRITKQNEKKLKNLLEVDQITGLMTKRKLSEEMEKILKNAKPHEYQLVSFDIDNFKQINQRYDLEKGNELLISIADAMKNYASKTSLLCRSKDDVFIVFGKSIPLSELNPKNGLFSMDRLERIVKSIGTDIPIHMSIGVYLIDNPSMPIPSMFDCLRQVRQLSKNSHGNTLTIYSDNLKIQKEKENQIINSMEHAIKNNEFFIVIQPKVALKPEKITGGEVLVRWKKADNTFVYPDDFIPIFEKNAFIIILDKYVFDAACKFVKNSPIKLPMLSINVSAITALSASFIEDYMHILNKYGLSADQFEIELTESVINVDFEKFRQIATHLKSLGFHLAIDDFGKGASSLTRINTLDIDVIKLDKEFISANTEAERGTIIIESILTMANKLRITTVAEGIEVQDDFKMMKDLGCDLGQGYLFAKPLATDEFLDRVLKDSAINEENTKLYQ